MTMSDKKKTECLRKEVNAFANGPPLKSIINENKRTRMEEKMNRILDMIEKKPSEEE